ncbi:Stress responsive A/B Barrel Domain protein [Aquisphaera giovannonii]|uniref:Stress responsive A/B Barrel Domain protein n=1 Tax=Aquisphaera giovannonii TaxID=406548 RepID=A0A5B9W3N7_9BACT|nr:Dabb family protein [Aquisphaera giovannonii]QEH34864.1 Stress responsive A/B Barrel Domain protein [Aquisphaera giovannonii]
MKNLVIAGLVVALGSVLAVGASAPGRAAAGPKVAHMVFFKLKDGSKESRDKLVAACEKYLKGQEGCVYFSVGTRAADVDEPVSVKDFDVALHVVFESKEGKLKYLKSEGHDKFLEAVKADLEGARVFDSYLAGD